MSAKLQSSGIALVDSAIIQDPEINLINVRKVLKRPKPIMLFTAPNRKKFFGKVDTGADFSIIPKNFIKKLGLDQDHRSGLPRLKGAGGTALKKHGSAEIQLCSDNFTYAIDGIVLDTVDKMLLGADFFDEYNALIACVDGIWTLYSGKGDKIADNSCEQPIQKTSTIHYVSEKYDETDETQEMELDFDNNYYKCPEVSTDLVPEGKERIEVVQIHPEAHLFFTPDWIEEQTVRFKKENMPPCKLKPVHIKLKPDCEMIKSKLYVMSPEKAQAAKDLTADFIKKGILVPSTGPNCMPGLIVPKKKGPNGEKRFRMIGDFRELNEKCVKSPKPLRSLESLFDTIPPRTTCFTVLDMVDGFFQMPVAKDSQHFLSMVYPHGLTQGFTNSTGELQGGVGDLLDDAVRANKLSKSVQLFVDDLLEHAKGMPDLFYRTNRLLNVLWENGIQINPSKCTFGASKVRFSEY